MNEYLEDPSFLSPYFISKTVQQTLMKSDMGIYSESIYANLSLYQSNIVVCPFTPQRGIGP
jgi:hypothetical protein